MRFSEAIWRWDNREIRKQIIYSSIPAILTPYSLPGLSGTGNINYYNEMDREVAYFGKADIESIPLNSFCQETFTPRDPVRNPVIQHFPTEQHYLPLFFVLEDTSGNDVTIPVCESGRKP